MVCVAAVVVAALVVAALVVAALLVAAVAAAVVAAIVAAVVAAVCVRSASSWLRQRQPWQVLVAAGSCVGCVVYHSIVREALQRWTVSRTATPPSRAEWEAALDQCGLRCAATYELTNCSGWRDPDKDTSHCGLADSVVERIWRAHSAEASDGF